MSTQRQKTVYVKYNIGDIVKERDWIIISDVPMYGIIVKIERSAYKKTEWIPYTDDRAHVFWFQWGGTEILPSCFLELISKS